MSAQKEQTLSKEEWDLICLKRARAVLMDYYGQGESVPIYGLNLQRVQSDKQLWDVFQYLDEEEEEIKYIDTIDVSQIFSAAQLLEHVLSYYPKDKNVESIETDSPNETEEPDPTPTFH